MKTHPPRHRGLTLIELLAAASLSGLLMVSLIQVIVAIGRDARQMDAEQQRASEWTNRLHDTLRSDLDVAHTSRWEGTRLVLEGSGGWDVATRAPIHEPAKVSYFLINPDGSPFEGTGQASDGFTAAANGLAGLLVREQSDILDLSQKRPYRTLMAVGVQAFEMRAVAAGESTDVAAPLEPGAEGPGASGTTATSAPRLVLQLGDGGEIVVLHEGLPRSSELQPTSIARRAASGRNRTGDNPPPLNRGELR